MEALEEITEVEGIHPEDAGQSNGWKLTYKPHPKSYGTHLPLKPTQSMALTPAERKSPASRPIQIRLRGTALQAQVANAMRAVEKNERNCKSTLAAAHYGVKRFAGVQKKGAEMSFVTVNI